MEKDLSLGQVAQVKLNFSKGIATVSLSALNDGVSLSASMSAGVLIDLLFSEIESKSSASAVAVEESIKTVVKEAVLSIQ